jgi:hypothetical protein
MPTYQNATPPNALYPGDVGYSWNNEAFPGANTSGAQFALSTPGGYAPETGFTVRWQTIFGGVPSAISIKLQGAMADVDAEYQDMDASTSTVGEARQVTGAQAKFLRIKLYSSTGGSGLTAKILV